MAVSSIMPGDQRVTPSGIRYAVVIVPVLVLLWSGISLYLLQKYNTGIEAARQDSRNLARAFEENIRRTVEAIDTTIRSVRAGRTRDPAHFNLQTWQRESGQTTELTLQISVADRQGIIIASSLPFEPGRTSIADREHFRLPRDSPDDRLFISRPLIGRVSGRWSVQFVRKLLDTEGRFDGVVVASFDPTYLGRFYTSLDIGLGTLLLTGKDGIVRAAAPSHVAAPGTDLSQTDLVRAASNGMPATIRMTDAADHIDRIYSWRDVAPYDLVVAVGLSVTDALEDYRQDLRASVAIGVVLTVATILMSVALLRNRLTVLRSREILRAAVDNISQGLLVIDAELRVPVLNARAVELLGLPAEFTRPGFAFDALLDWQTKAGEFDGPDAESVRALVGVGGIKVGTSSYQRIRRDGTMLEIRTQVLDTGLAVRTFTDVTEQRHAARILAEARDAAEAAANARAEFLAVMSHEIRTPLNGVIGLAELLEEMELGETQRNHVRMIRESGDHLLVLINDILDISRLEASRVQLEAAEFDPGQLLRGVAGMFLVQANSKGLRLSVTVAEDIPPLVIGDGGRLRQVLLNLVGNAIKFTDHGWISLDLSVEAIANDRMRLKFSVADSGIGILPEAIDRMFDEFTQVDSSISRRFGGSGLGLAISRRLVELMSGTIAVESQPGVGSTFRFDVMAGRLAADVMSAGTTGGIGESQSEAADTASSVAGLRVLLVEDNPTNRIVAMRLLDRLGHTTDAVGTGLEAVAATAHTEYDLVLMDVMMPEMDGLTATSRIRSAEPPHLHVVIIGLTAGARPETLADCLAAGMDAVATKPVTIGRLRAAITEGRRLAGLALESQSQAVMASRLSELTEELGSSAVDEIIGTFAQDTTRLLQTMRDAAVQGDGRALHEAAHCLTGAAGNVGAIAVGRLAKKLEQQSSSFGRVSILAEVAKLQIELDAALRSLATRHTPGASDCYSSAPVPSGDAGFRISGHESAASPQSTSAAMN